jgi:hypothetical protein
MSEAIKRRWSKHRQEKKIDKKIQAVSASQETGLTDAGRKSCRL